MADNAPNLQGLWLPDDLRAVADAASEAVTATVALLRRAAKPDEGPEADRQLCERMRRVLHFAQKTRDLARPLTKELVDAHKRSGAVLPTVGGVTDAFAVGVAASFAYAALEAYCLPFETDDSWGSLLSPNPPADPTIMPQIRNRLRALAMPNGRVLRELIDKEVRIAASIRLDCNPAPPLAPARHGPDYRSVHWFGTDYVFTEAQAAVVRVLWQAWENGTPGVGFRHLREVTRLEFDRLGDVFKEKGKYHPAWNAMIKTGVGSKGEARLCPPEKSLP
jgi:hypothetical protein